MNFIVLDQSHVQVSTKTHLRQWEIKSALQGYCLKVVGNEIFVTAAPLHQILIYTSKGQLVKKYGKEIASSKKGEFYNPKGIATDNIFIYS